MSSLHWLETLIRNPQKLVMVLQRVVNRVINQRLLLWQGQLPVVVKKSVATPKAGTSSSGSSAGGAAGAGKLTVAQSLAKPPMTGTKPKAESLPVEDESDIVEEMLLIKEQMKQLDDEERRLRKSKKLQEMREELRAKQQKVNTLGGKAKLCLL